jgi:hypothetical protein
MVQKSRIVTAVASVKARLVHEIASLALLGRADTVYLCKSFRAMLLLPIHQEATKDILLTNSTVQGSG